MQTAQRVRVPDPLAELQGLPPTQPPVTPDEMINELIDEVAGDAAAQIEAEVDLDGPPPLIVEEAEIVYRINGRRNLAFTRFLRDLREAPEAVRRYRQLAVNCIIKCWRQSRRRMLMFILTFHVESVRRRVYAGSHIVEWARHHLCVRHGRESIEPKLSSRWSEIWPLPVPWEEACVVNGVVTADLIAELRTERLENMVFSFAPLRPSSWGCATTYDYWSRVTRVFFGNHTAAIEFKTIGFRIVAHNAAAVSWIVRIVLEGYAGQPLYDLFVHSSMDCRERVDYLCGRRVYSAGHSLSWREPTDDTSLAVPQVPPEHPAYEVVIDDHCMCLTPRMREGLLLIHRSHEVPSGPALMELMRDPQGLAQWRARLRYPTYRGALPSRFTMEEVAYYTSWRTKTFTVELPLIGMWQHGHCHRWGETPLWKRHRAARHLTQAVRRAVLSEVSRAIIETAMMDERDETGRMPVDRFVDVQSAMLIERELHSGCALTIHDTEFGELGERRAVLASIHSSQTGGARFGVGVSGDPNEYVLCLPQIGMNIRAHNPAATRFLFFWASTWYSRGTWKPTRYDYVYVLNQPGYRSSSDPHRIKYYPRSALYETDRVTIKWNRRHPTYLSARPGASPPTRGYIGDGAGPSSEDSGAGDVEVRNPLTASEVTQLRRVRPMWNFHQELTEKERQKARKLLARYAHLFASADAPAPLPPLGIRTESIEEELIEEEPIEEVEDEAISPQEERPQDISEEDVVEDLTDCTCPYWCALHDRPLSCNDVVWTPAGDRYFLGPFVGRGKPRDSGTHDRHGFMSAVDGAAELIATGYAHQVIMRLHHCVRPGPIYELATLVVPAVIEFAIWYLQPGRSVGEMALPQVEADQSIATTEEEDEVEEEEVVKSIEQDEEECNGGARSELAIQMTYALRSSALESTDGDVPQPTPPVGRRATPETPVRVVYDEEEQSRYSHQVLMALHHSMRPGPFHYTYSGGQLAWYLHPLVATAIIDFAVWYLHPDRVVHETVLPWMEVGHAATTTIEGADRVEEEVESNVSWQAAHDAEYNLACSDEQRGYIQMHADDPEAQEAWAFRNDDEEEQNEDVEEDDEEADDEAAGSGALVPNLTIEDMLDRGIITRVNTPWAATARMPNGAIDYRPLNAMLERSHPETPIEDELQLRPSRVITPAEDELELRWELNRLGGQVPSDLWRAVESS